MKMGLTWYIVSLVRFTSSAGRLLGRRACHCGAFEPACQSDPDGCCEHPIVAMALARSTRSRSETLRSVLPRHPKRGDVVTNPRDGAEMIFIPACEFMRGENRYKDEKPQHKISLDGYWIYKHEVTVVQYGKFCGETGRDMPPEPPWAERKTTRLST